LFKQIILGVFARINQFFTDHLIVEKRELKPKIKTEESKIGTSPRCLFLKISKGDISKKRG